MSVIGVEIGASWLGHATSLTTLRYDHPQRLRSGSLDGSLFVEESDANKRQRRALLSWKRENDEGRARFNGWAEDASTTDCVLVLDNSRSPPVYLLERIATLVTNLREEQAAPQQPAGRSGWQTVGRIPVVKKVAPKEAAKEGPKERKPDKLMLVSLNQVSS